MADLHLAEQQHGRFWQMQPGNPPQLPKHLKILQVPHKESQLQILLLSGATQQKSHARSLPQKWAQGGEKR